MNKRPVKFTSQGGTTTIHCGYDYMGRRFEKKVTVNGTITLHHRYLYRGYLQIVSLDAKRANMQDLWLIHWDPTQPTATRPLSIRKNGAWYTYGHDLTKNVTEVFNTSGAIATSYDYTPFGAVTANGIDQPFQWSSEIYDSELALTYYNYRHYNPMDGRWINRDPIAEQGGYNLYGFVGNGPVRLVDVLGLQNIRSDNKLSDLYSRMSELCDCSCCKKKEDIENCKKDAKKVSDKINELWNKVSDGTIPHGPNSTNKDSVNGYLCWDWADAFLRVASQALGDSKSWSYQMKRINANRGSSCHFYVVFCECSEKKDYNCCLAVDDGFFGNDEYVRCLPDWIKYFTESNYHYNPNKQNIPPRQLFCPGLNQIPIPQ